MMASFGTVGSKMFRVYVLYCVLCATSTQRTYKRACECEYTKNGKCAYSILTLTCPAMKDSTEQLWEEVTRLKMLIELGGAGGMWGAGDQQVPTDTQKQLQQLSNRISSIESQLSDIRHSFDVLGKDSSSTLSELSNIKNQYNLCTTQGITNYKTVQVSSTRDKSLWIGALHIHANSAWCPDIVNMDGSGSLEGSGSSEVEPNTDYEWVEFDFGEIRTIYGVVTKGRDDYVQWVTSYKLQYSNVGEQERQEDTWTVYKDVLGQDVIFEGNNDSQTAKINMLWQPVRARYFRIWPLTGPSNMCLRADFIGCSDS